MISPEYLHRFAFFGGLGEDQVRGIAILSEEVHFPGNTLLFNQDTVADHFYVIVSGEVDLIYNSGAAGGESETYVGSVVQGEVLGVSALIDPFRLRTAARTRGQVTALAISAAGLRAMCEVDPTLGYHLMRRLAQALFERLHTSRIQFIAKTE